MAKPKKKPAAAKKAPKKKTAPPAKKRRVAAKPAAPAKKPKVAAKKPKAGAKAAPPQASAGALWQRYVTWLRATAPEIAEELGPPATSDELDALAKAIGRPVPDAIREVLAITNGGDNVFGGLDLQSAAGIAADYGDFLEYADKQPAPLWMRALSDAGKSDGWIPFIHTAGGDHYCLDLDPGPRGVSGQIFRWNHDDDHDVPLASSLEELLGKVLQAIDAKQYVFDKKSEDFKFKGKTDYGFRAVAGPDPKPDPTAAAYEKAWKAFGGVVNQDRAASKKEIAALVAWGASLAKMSVRTLEANLDFAARAVHVGSAFGALFRAQAANPIPIVAKQLVNACTKLGYTGAYNKLFVQNLLGATTVLDAKTRTEVLSWALALHVSPDANVYFNAACALAKCGPARKDECLAYVVLARGQGKTPNDFIADDDFAALRGDPDFERAVNQKQDPKRPFFAVECRLETLAGPGMPKIEIAPGAFEKGGVNVSVARASYGLSKSLAHLIDKDPWRGLPIFDARALGLARHLDGAAKLFPVSLFEDTNLRPLADGWYLADKANVGEAMALGSPEAMEMLVAAGLDANKAKAFAR